jgi:hypothetical protein
MKLFSIPHEAPHGSRVGAENTFPAFGPPIGTHSLTVLTRHAQVLESLVIFTTQPISLGKLHRQRLPQLEFERSSHLAMETITDKLLSEGAVIGDVQIVCP